MHAKIGALFSSFLLSCSAGMPTVDNVLARYEAVLGGDALRAVRTVEVFGTVTGMGLTGTTYAAQDSSGRVMERIDIGPLGYAWGYGEDGGWIQDHSGVVRTLSQSELEEFLLLAQIGGTYPMSKELREKMRVSAEKSDETHTCVLVEHVGSPVELYFNRSNGLLERVRLSKLGTPVEGRFSQWRSVEGITLPFRVVQTIAGVFSLEMRVDSVRVNRPLGAVFRRPDAPAQPVEGCAVPVDLDGHLVAPVSVGEREALRFFVDSGAGMSCIDTRTAARLGLEVRGKLPAQGVVGLDSVGIVTLESLSVGCAQMAQARLAVVDLAAMSPPDRPVHGILGYGLFSQWAVGRLGARDSLLLRPPRLVLDSSFVSLPLQFTANVPTVEASIMGREGRFLVDTGNSFPLVVHTPFARREGIMPPREALSPSPAAGIGGVGEAYLGLVDSLRLGPTRLGPIEALFSPSGRGVTGAEEVAGNIGLPLLEQFDWVLDYQAGRLYLRPRHGMQRGPTHGEETR